ncbi:unnamed protein product [Closterium sp. NIES-53]
MAAGVGAAWQGRIIPRGCATRRSCKFPRSTHQVQQLVTTCTAARVPVIPYGAGTSLEGHVAALCGGVSIDLLQMNEVRWVRLPGNNEVPQKVPVIPYGASTSLEGHVAALCGGVSIDLLLMNECCVLSAEFQVLSAEFQVLSAEC